MEDIMFARWKDKPAKYLHLVPKLTLPYDRIIASCHKFCIAPVLLLSGNFHRLLLNRYPLLTVFRFVVFHDYERIEGQLSPPHCSSPQFVIQSARISVEAYTSFNLLRACFIDDKRQALPEDQSNNPYFFYGHS